MSQKIKVAAFVLSVIVIIFLSWNLFDYFDPNLKDSTITLGPNDPLYQAQEIRTDIYNLEGFLSYTITAQNAARYFHKKQAGDSNGPESITWFTKPVMVLFDDVLQPDWSLKADKAKLTDDDKMLYLYVDVELTHLIQSSYLKKITTESAQINLVTQDISSNDPVNLYGVDFFSSGMKMRGNLRSKKANLVEKVKTNYEIQKENP
ncbi:LPS export ABC transporter periplasmic protein LptC [Candidatus Williamhamiltonella defendens]|uniref:Lipopolysaccharide export system protein LptC n=1 Tax=Candidatus Hamiltonella defensa (Bemisia tabaci) TaxID=672795 RepID=A0A249DYV4_9ENTR|nr:LPS export ABC transporter periplasmic protein LptC [Candidatus Hamiltonella defensa]ASX26539.1 LPS export ABC transporter periplasmic protein LptC [Candidatus Hamiltonella defensa (Bemisia tabaci)]CED78453.1 Lipopolysaccharide export system protein LptC [Candidatus Hamiltonella defensa (Bemisia tabaci)]